MLSLLVYLENHQYDHVHTFGIRRVFIYYLKSYTIICSIFNQNVVHRMQRLLRDLFKTTLYIVGQRYLDVHVTRNYVRVVFCVGKAQNTFLITGAVLDELYQR